MVMTSRRLAWIIQAWRPENEQAGTRDKTGVKHRIGSESLPHSTSGPVICGTYHAIGAKHLPRSVAEFSYRLNRRYDLAATLTRLATAEC